MEEKVKCPKCNSENIAVLVFGYTIMDKFMIEKIKAKKIKLGGCIVCNDSKQWHCNECGEEF